MLPADHALLPRFGHKSRCSWRQGPRSNRSVLQSGGGSGAPGTGGQRPLAQLSARSVSQHQAVPHEASGRSRSHRATNPHQLSRRCGCAWPRSSFSASPEAGPRLGGRRNLSDSLGTDSTAIDPPETRNLLGKRCTSDRCRMGRPERSPRGRIHPAARYIITPQFPRWRPPFSGGAPLGPLRGSRVRV